ncbi:MAG: hypothetical protein Q9216_006037 [Gyalolechia sp. 2 TL-2023]
MTTRILPKQWRKTPTRLEQDPDHRLSTTESSPLGELPAELRLHIYSYLVTPGTIHIWRCNNLLSNTLCPRSSHDPKTFGPSGTLKKLVAGKDFNQDELAEEVVCLHDDCLINRKHPRRSRISFSIFLTCRLFYAEARDIINNIYVTSTFHFIHTPALELFVDTLSPANKNLLRQLHINLPVARSYKGVRRSLNQTLNRLAPNPYVNGLLPGRIPDHPPKLRIRIQFNQYSTDEIFSTMLAPSVRDLLSRLPFYLFSSIVVIVPPLPPRFIVLTCPLTRQRYRTEDKAKWYTKIIPSHSVDCLCLIVTDVMGARHLIKEKQKAQHGVLMVDQWKCCNEIRGDQEAWWAAGRRDLEVRMSLFFGV